MTAPRTDPPSTVPVEPLSGHVWRTKTSIRDGSKTGRFVVDWEEAEAALDAARASQPITATPTVEAGHNHTTAGLPTYPVCRGACPLGCDTPLPPTERVEVRPGEFLPRPRMAILDPFAEGEAIIAVKAAEAKERLILAAIPVREDEPTGIDAPSFDIEQYAIERGRRDQREGVKHGLAQLAYDRDERCMAGGIGGSACDRAATHDAYLRGGPAFGDNRGTPVCSWHGGSVNRLGFTAIKRDRLTREASHPLTPAPTHRHWTR